MKRIIVDQSGRVASWVSARIPGKDDFPEDARAIGLEQDGEVIAGVVYTMYTGSGVCMHVAAVPGARWMTRDFLYTVFAYPFLQLQCRRVTGLVRTDNEPAQRFDEHLGFVCEGVMRAADDDGCDLIVYGMLREECRWLNVRKQHG